MAEQFPPERIGQWFIGCAECNPPHVHAANQTPVVRTSYERLDPEKPVVLVGQWSMPLEALRDDLTLVNERMVIATVAKIREWSG